MSAPIFISHASENSTVAGRIVAYLESKGVPCWISSRDISPKEIYAEAITQAMRGAQSCLVIVSEPANASAAVKRELELASRYDKPFIPVRIDATEPGAGLDYYLNNTQWVDYGRDRERALDRVVAAYGVRTGQAPVAEPVAAPTSRALDRRRLILPGLLAIGALAAVWLTAQSLRPPAEPGHAASVGATLVGVYRWEGIACGAGPTVTQDPNGELVFTMTGAPTYRHEIVEASSNAGIYAVLLRTQLRAPADLAGQQFSLGIRTSDNALVVRSPDRVDEWQRCEPTSLGSILNGATLLASFGEAEGRLENDPDRQVAYAVDLQQHVFYSIEVAFATTPSGNVPALTAELVSDNGDRIAAGGGAGSYDADIALTAPRTERFYVIVRDNSGVTDGFRVRLRPSAP